MPFRSAALLALALAPIALAQTPDAAAHTPVEVTGDHLEQSSHCNNGEPLRILANDSRLSVLGNCSVITVVGSRNWISIQHARSILATGGRNTVLYSDRSTRVDDRGKANSVAERWPQ